ncbi:DAO-domain-containing protein [Periconia macrospinosa]|uniref:DAO-domain-containing protein n=1 Tax=Periconia macrospinosa TaxID=97972 RepID=A0A2V1D7N5_9PLEO|nr:DAO-domain-containing protein [Periconia macrospinosa]
MGAIFSALQNAIKGLKAAISLLINLSSEFNQALKRASQPPGLPAPEPTEPYWLNDPPFPKLVNVRSYELPQTADVAIIGSGIAGAAIARSLLHERRRCNIDTKEKVVVFEARQLCSGATARNGGHIKVAPYEAFARFSKEMAKDRAAALVRFQMQHVETLIGLCKNEGIEIAEARSVQTVDLFLDDQTFREAVESVEEMKKYLPEVEISVWDRQKTRENFDANHSVVGALSYRAGAIWAYRFTVSIWERLLADFPDNLTIETDTPVEAVNATDDGPEGFPYAVKTTRGTLYVRHVVHATNAFASHLVPGLRNKIVGARAHMSAQQPGKNFTSFDGMRSWSIIYKGGFDYVSQRPCPPGTTQGDLLLGGGFMRSAKQGMDQIGIYDDSLTLDALTVSHIAGIFPAIFAPKWGMGAGVKQVWSGILGLTGDSLPFVGLLGTKFTGRNVLTQKIVSPGAHQHGEWIAAGFCGEGMVWAWLCGTGLGIMIAGTEKQHVEESPGRPGGKLGEWLPRELLVSNKRVRTADISNLANQI